MHGDIVRRCLVDPIFCGSLFFNYQKLNSDFHRAFQKWLLTNIANGENRFFVLLPRDHLKTSYLGCAFMLWLLIRDPDKRILYTMATRDQAQKTLSVIQKGFKSSRLAHFFPDRVLDPHDPDMKSTRSYLTLRRPNDWRENSIEALGLDSAITGGHFNVQIFDDLVDATMARSSLAQQRAIDFVQDSTNMQISPDKDLKIILGTLWEGEFYEWAIANEAFKKYYKTLVLGCYVDDRYFRFLDEIGLDTTQIEGDPLWPEEFSRETLERIAMEQGPAKFSRQFLNIPMVDEFQRFRKEDFVEYELSPDRQYAIIGEGEYQIRRRIDKMKVTMVVDPATGEGPKTDATAISVTAKDEKTGIVFVLEDWAKRALPHETIEQIFAFAQKWPVQIVSPEDAAYQMTLKHYLRAEMYKRGARFTIRPVKPGNRSKGTRIEGLEPWVRNGKVAVRREHFGGVVREAENVVIVRGMVQGRSPNRLDALAYQITHWGALSLPSATKSDTEEIEDWTPLREKGERRAYGLSCST